MKHVLVTGVAGSGKTTLCDTFNKMGFEAYDIESIPKLFVMQDKVTGGVMTRHNNDNLEIVKRGDWLCDKERLTYILKSQSTDLAFYCGVATNITEIMNLFDKTFMLRASEKNTLKRLAARKNGEFGNTNEVQRWILSWKEEAEASIMNRGAVVIDANQGPQEVASDILDKL